MNKDRSGRHLLPLAFAGAILYLFSGCEVTPESQRRVLLENILRERAADLDGSDIREVAGSLVRAEDRFSVDAILVVAMMEFESGYDKDACSGSGARGLLQIRPSTAAHVAESHDIAYGGAHDLHDPATNLSIGTAYLADLKAEFGTWEMALAAYLRGPGNLRKALEKGGPVRSRYASRVMRRYRIIREAYLAESSWLYLRQQYPGSITA